MMLSIIPNSRFKKKKSVICIFIQRLSNRVSLGNPFHMLTIKPSSIEKWS